MTIAEQEDDCQSHQERIEDMIKEQPLKVIAGAVDCPLVIGDIKIACYVLEGETRVLTQRGMIAGIGLKSGGGSGGVDTKTPRFFTSKLLNPILSDDLRMKLDNPILFWMPQSKIRAYGYPANILPDICELIINAKESEKLTKQQYHVFEQCKVLMHGFARIGIIGLVDEATGYQSIREKDALQEILNTYLQDNQRKWSKTFPDVFWQKLVKVKGYQNYTAIKRPQFVGHWVNDIVYDRLAPGIREKLNDLNPAQSDGGRPHKHHQHLTENHGVPELKEHLIKVMALMDASANDKQFKIMLNRVVPKFGNTIEMNLGDDTT